MKRRIPIAAVIISISLFAVACGTLQVGVEDAGEVAGQGDPSKESITPEAPLVASQPTTTLEEPQPTSDTKRHVFEQLGISLEVPQDLYVHKDLDVNYEDQSKLDSYLFYIQNYGYPGGPSSGNFQMYGLLQYSLPPISWEAFSDGQVNSPMNAYANYIEVEGLRGYDTQVAGERNRYVYYFHLDGRVLSIAVADPTPENKALADEIIQSLALLPGGSSDASHLKLVRDPNRMFQILIPDDWESSFQATIGMQLSSLEATSPDFEIIVEDEVEGPHSNIHYKQGIFLHVQVIEDESAGQIADWPNQWQYVVYFNGIEGTVYVYKEPSTAEGELRTAIVIYEGKTYILRFGYADDADLDTIDRIISSFNITHDTFYPPQ